MTEPVRPSHPTKWHRRPLPVFLVAAGVAAVVFVAGLVGIHLTMFSVNEPAALANAAGAVGVLFSGLAFAGLITALLMQRIEVQLQRRELRLQRRELRMQRHEAARTRAEFENQSGTMERDLFERHFFQLLEMNRQTADALRVQFDRDGPVIGALAFTVAAERLTERLRLEAPDRTGPEATAFTAGAWYEENGLRFRTEFGQYFRSLFHVVRFIDQASLMLTLDDRRHYARVVRAQLSSSQLLMLLANCHSEAGAGFLGLAVKYEFFKVAAWPVEINEKANKLVAHTIALAENHAGEEVG